MAPTVFITLLAGKRLASDGQAATNDKTNTTFAVVMYLTAIVYTITLLLGVLRLSPYLLRCKSRLQKEAPPPRLSIHVKQPKAADATTQDSALATSRVNQSKSHGDNPNGENLLGQSQEKEYLNKMLVQKHSQIQESR